MTERERELIELLALLVLQIELGEPVDKHGHKLTMNQVFIDAQNYLRYGTTREAKP